MTEISKLQRSSWFTVFCQATGLEWREPQCSIAKNGTSMKSVYHSSGDHDRGRISGSVKEDLVSMIVL